MTVRTLPWWRKALAFALDGIRSGFGLFRRNGNHEAGTDADLPGGAAAQSVATNRIEEEESKPEDPGEESRVKPTSPQSEPAADKEQKDAACEPRQTAPVAQEPAAEAEPVIEPEAAAGVEPVAVAEAPVQASETAPQEATALRIDPALAEDADPPVSSAGETAMEQPCGAAPREEDAETVNVAVESMLEEAAVLEPEATQEEESISHQMETPAYQSEPEPEEKAAHEVAPVPDEAVAPVELAAEAAPAAETGAQEPESAIAIEAASVAEAPSQEPESKSSAEPVTAAAPPEPAPSAESGSPASASPVAEAVPAPPEEIAPTLPFAEKSAERTTAEKVAAALKARGEDADQSPFSVIVNQVYDGPLDLLLDLIRKQDIDIYDIPIARITAQFLAYVDRLRATDVDVAGEFIYTAALLIHIKSKMLLPRAPAGPDDASEDPRRELVERLLEHERFKNAAQMLHEKQMLEAATWTNPGIREFKEDAEAEPEIAADTTDLVRVFSSILERARNRPILDVQEDSVTVGQMIQFLSRRLTMEDKPVALRRLLSHTNSERALIAMFLALLELVRLQAILLRQDRHFSEIFIKKHEGFESLMNQGLANARDDWR
ncbi:MAG: segregation/condensation protein A [Terracidiphilus sp.]